MNRFHDHLIFYRAVETAHSIELIRILHGARDLPRVLLDREE